MDRTMARGSADVIVLNHRGLFPFTVLQRRWHREGKFRGPNRRFRQPIGEMITAIMAMVIGATTGTCCGLTLREEDQRQDGGSPSSSSEGRDWVEMRSRRGYGR
ncbi:hypothetical protein NL676_005951 [Syzygium grande]|nr:hypothetical protein NL676_005951 [Syzygium grande]